MQTSGFSNPPTSGRPLPLPLGRDTDSTEWCLASCGGGLQGFWEGVRRLCWAA